MGLIVVLWCRHPSNRGLDVKAIVGTCEQNIIKQVLTSPECAPLFCFDHINVHDLDVFRGDKSCSNYSALLNQEVVSGDCLFSGQHLDVHCSVVNSQISMVNYLNIQTLLLHLQNYFRSHRVPHLSSTPMANNQQI